MRIVFLIVLYAVTIQIVYNVAPGIAMALVGLGVVYALHDSFN